MRPEFSQTYRARFGFSGSAPPVQDFVFTVNRIPSPNVASIAATQPIIDLGNAAVLPWLINAHTHLELSGFDQPIGDPTRGFPAWIREVISWRRSQIGTPEELFAQRRAAVFRGARESLACGAGFLYDIVSPNWGDLYRELHASLEIGVCRFQEVLGLSTARENELYAQAEQATFGINQQGHLQELAGLSPHAPYTVGVELLTKLAKLSAVRKFPLAMHLAESLDELELLRSHSGAFHSLLSELGAWDPSAFPRGIAILDYLKILASAHSAYVIHGNYLSKEELDFLAAHRNLKVVYCPRTHAYFGHSAYPLPEMLEQGINICIGTDSRASNPDLNIWNELRYVADTYPELPLDVILGLAIQPGSTNVVTESPAWDTFIVVDLPDEECDDPYELLFDPRSRVREGYWAGVKTSVAST